MIKERWLYPSTSINPQSHVKRKPAERFMNRFKKFLHQVSRLVIIHEEGEAGHQMPDLERPVQAVSKVSRKIVLKC